MDKLNVIPTQEQINAANAANDAILAEASIQSNIKIPDSELEAIRQMELEAEEHVKRIKEGGQIIRPDLAETENQRKVAVGTAYSNSVQNETKVRPPIEKPIVQSKPITPKADISNHTQKQINAPYDLIPLPSEGKIYPHKKSHLKVAYLNASDEDVLTSPNILQSGEFLKIIIDGKILDEGVTYDSLHIGDRNAIMIWLRATGYGEMYPIVAFDNDSRPFEAVIDLSTLPYKKLGAEPDEEGLFTYILPVSKKTLKFRLLNVKETEELEDLIQFELDSEDYKYSKSITHRLEKMIVEIDGVRDSNAIYNYIKIMRAGDSRGLRNYYDEIESGVDLNIKVETPTYKTDSGEVRGGDLIETFLPINLNFFWPDFRA